MLPKTGWYYYENPDQGRGIICVENHGRKNLVWEFWVFPAYGAGVKFHGGFETSHNSTKKYKAPDDTIFRPAKKKEIDYFKSQYMISLI